MFFLFLKKSIKYRVDYSYINKSLLAYILQTIIIYYQLATSAIVLLRIFHELHFLRCFCHRIYDFIDAQARLIESISSNHVELNAIVSLKGSHQSRTSTTATPDESLEILITESRRESNKNKALCLPSQNSQNRFIDYRTG